MLLLQCLLAITAGIRRYLTFVYFSFFALVGFFFIFGRWLNPKEEISIDNKWSVMHNFERSIFAMRELE